MAKKKSSYSEVNEYKEMSLNDLESRFYEIAQRAEEKNAMRQTASSGQSAVRKPSDPPSSFASLDLGGGVESASDFDTMTTEQLAQKYLDPATLESRPEFADGSAPEKAIMKSPEGSFWERTKLSFSNQPLAKQVKMLEEEYGAGNVQLTKGKNLAVKQNGAWYQLDPQGGGQGDWFDKAIERTQDVLADNADIAVSVGAGIPAAIAAAPLVAGLGGAAAVAGLAGVGASSAATGAMSRILMGRLVGTYEATPEEMMKEIGVETVLGAAGQAFLPGVSYGARELGAKFMKAAPVLNEAAPGVKDTMAKVIGYTSGVGEEVADHWLNNAEKVGRQVARYGRDEQAALMANITQTKEVAEGIIQARNKFGQDLYGSFAKEAGNEFAPWIGKVFTSSNVADEISLIKDGVLKWDGKGSKLLINSADEMVSANPTMGSIFQNPQSRKALNLVVNELNEFNKYRPAVGEEGARQFIAFKQRINNAVNKAVTLAQEAGDTEAIRHIKGLQAEVKTSFLQKAVDATRAPELASKLASIDKQYADMKSIIKPFEDAVKRGSKDGLNAYRSLYENTFGGVNLNSKKAVAKNQLQQTLQTLGKYKPELTELVDDIGARKAALASVPWFRKGLVGQAAALGSVTTLNPAVISGAAMTSPKLNFQAAKLASSMYDGLDFIRKMSPDMKKQFLKSPEAVANFYKTVASVPGMEAQITTQLGNQLRGQQNGQ